VASPKHSTGRLVNNPAVAAPMLRSALMMSSTGDTATIGPRRLRAISRIANTSTVAWTPPAVVAMGRARVTAPILLPDRPGRSRG
jgi:hypothetical protein